MTEPYPSPVTSESLKAGSPDASVGQLVSQVTDSFSTLLRQEVALARAELKQEARKSSRAGGLLGGAGFAGYLCVVLVSFAAAWALDEALPRWAAFGIVALVYGLVALALYSMGRKELATVDPTPHQTIDTLKKGMP